MSDRERINRLVIVTTLHSFVIALLLFMLMMFWRGQ
jgi:predicted secreted protein